MGYTHFSGVDADVFKINGTQVTATADEINGAVDLSAQGALVRTKKIAIGTPADGSEIDSGFDLPDSGLVLDVFLNVTTQEATGSTKTLDIGTLSGESGGDADGFADALSVAATGIVRPQATVTTGGTETYYSANTRGVLLSDYLAGSNTADDFGIYREKPYPTDANTAKSVSYTAGSADFDELVAELYIVYVEIG